MRKITIICVLVTAACTMKMPDHKKAESAVRRILDSTYSPKPVQVLEFKNFISLDDYLNQQKQNIYLSKEYKEMSEIDKGKFKAKVESVFSYGNSSRKGSSINCLYKVDGKIRITKFFIDTAFRTVYTIK